jgi:hypothetical protein
MSDAPRDSHPSVFDEATYETRVYQGRVGRIVFTVQADTPRQARALARICGLAVEDEVFRVFRERLERR